jgi:hypothetical protein
MNWPLMKTRGTDRPPVIASIISCTMLHLALQTRTTEVMREVHAGTDLNVLPVIPLIQFHDLVRNIKLIHRLLGLRAPQHITLCLRHATPGR